MTKPMKPVGLPAGLGAVTDPHATGWRPPKTVKQKEQDRMRGVVQGGVAEIAGLVDQVLQEGGVSKDLLDQATKDYQGGNYTSPALLELASMIVTPAPVKGALRGLGAVAHGGLKQARLDEVAKIVGEKLLKTYKPSKGIQKLAERSTGLSKVLRKDPPKAAIQGRNVRAPSARPAAPDLATPPPFGPAPVNPWVPSYGTPAGRQYMSRVKPEMSPSVGSMSRLPRSRLDSAGKTPGRGIGPGSDLERGMMSREFVPGDVSWGQASRGAIGDLARQAVREPLAHAGVAAAGYGAYETAKNPQKMIDQAMQVGGAAAGAAAEVPPYLMSAAEGFSRKGMQGVSQSRQDYADQVQRNKFHRMMMPGNLPEEERALLLSLGVTEVMR